MTNAQLLLAVILLQQGLFGVVWAIAARLRLSPRPARHWAAATWLVAAGMSLILLRGTLPLWLTLGVANLLLVVSFVLLRRGIQIFTRQRPIDPEHVSVVVLSGFGLAASVVLAAQPMLLVLVTSAAMSWTLLRCGSETYHALRHEFGRSTARWCALPTVVIGTLLLLRSIVAFALGEQVDASVATSGFKNAGLVYASLAFGLIINTTLFAMTVIRLVRRLQHQSDHDVLTDLLNRRAMQRLLSGEARRQKRVHGSYAVMSVDVDHYKAINDAHGHPKCYLM
jgi:predicted signal transduction protein with EAL and GGDEF domain